MQEVTTRLPGLVGAAGTAFASTADLAGALRRAEAALTPSTRSAPGDQTSSTARAKTRTGPPVPYVASNDSLHSRRLNMSKTILITGASKFAVEALTDSLRYEVSRLGVEVVEVQPSAYPTSFLTGIQAPAGTEVARSYGEVGRIPGALFKSLTSTFEGKDAPNPHDVAEAIGKLIGQAKGSRAVRTVVGAPFGSDKANEDVAPVQAKVVEALGLSHLEKVA
ncbi:MAG TPA: hypothetical protein VF070_26640 [Streptosporangiaceae bacterium]